MTHKERETRPGYNDRFETVYIPEEEKIIGPKISKLFNSRLRRMPPWITQNGVVIITRSGERIEGLEKEKISEEFARTIDGFKMVEDFLPDFVGKGNKLVRGNHGLFEVNTQWANEELNHGSALGSILVQTGHKTEEQIEDEYHKNREKVWELPFATSRQIVAHAAFQERGTFVAYQALQKRAEDEGALRTAKILGLISTDESYHHVGYNEITKVYYEEDPEGTRDDVIYVAENFRMPAENLHPNRLQWIKDLIRVGAFSRDLVAEKIVYRTLQGFRFVPEDIARKIADEYLKK